jgi:hypothetical protein
LIALTAVSATVGAYVIVDDPIFNGLAISSVFGLAVFTLLAVVVAFIVLCGAFAILCDGTAAMARRRWHGGDGTAAMDLNRKFYPMIKRFLPWLVLLLAIAVFMVLRMTRPELDQAEAQERAWLVAVQSAELIAATPLLPLYGQVVAPRQLTVTAALPGQIAQRPVSEGQAVAAGTLLVALDDADVAPALAQAQADVADLQAQIEAEQLRHGNDQRALKSEQSILASAQRQLERNQMLLKRNLTSREALDDVTAAYARAELLVSAPQRSRYPHPHCKRSNPSQ